MSDDIGPKAFHAAEGTADWRVISEGATAFFRTDSFLESAGLVGAIAGVPGIGDHAPGIDIRHDGVTVRLITKSDRSYGMSDRDVELARLISGVARDRGLHADPSRVQNLLVVPGALNITEVMPFWQAALGYERRPDSPDEDLVDPHDHNAAFWFETMNEPRGDGGGAIHIAVWVAREEAESRVAAALAAGGRLVRDDRAPAWWTLADAAGNEVDIATTEMRG